MRTQHGQRRSRIRTRARPGAREGGRRRIQNSTKSPKTTGSFEVQALDAFAVGYLSAPLLEVFGKLGLVYWDAEAVVEGGFTHFRDSDNGVDIAYGGGVQAHLGSLALRLEYENFEVSDTEKLDLWSLGFTFTFL